MNKEESVKIVTDIVKDIIPYLNKLDNALVEIGADSYELINNNGNKFVWLPKNNTKEIVSMQSQDISEQLKNEILVILDGNYGRNVSNFMGMVWSHNFNVADSISRVVANKIKSERIRIENQLLDILTVFKEGE